MTSTIPPPATSVTGEIASEPQRSPAAWVTHASSHHENIQLSMQNRRRSGITEEHERETLLAEFMPRELDILQLLAQGLDIAMMAQRLDIPPHTVEWHLSHLIEKLHIRSNFDAVIVATQKGLIQR
jgi:DNA-binding NarL/FixJ family response regulator